MTTMCENVNSGRKISWPGLLGIFAVLWIVPPFIHDLLHLCPVRPDGINSVQAVPSFARKYRVSCTQCHSEYPLLNDFGRQFKLNGYVMEKGGKEGVAESKDGLQWIEQNFPLGFMVRSRPYDKAGADSEFKMQAIHDIDLIAAGGDAAKNVSWFGEVQSAAADSNSFQPTIGDLQMGYHPTQYFNLIAARRGFFVMDPYQTLSDFGSPTIANRATAGLQATQGALSGDTLDETKQTIAVFGQTSKEHLGALYYAAGVSADKGDDQGGGPKDTSARLAYDTQNGFVVGTFGSFGAEGPAVTSSMDKVQFSKTGVDALFEKGSVVARSAFLYAYDKDLANGTRETNRSAYAEVLYIFKKAGSDIPFLVPLVRENWYQTINAQQEFNYITAQVAHFFAQNVKAFIEYSGDTKQDNGTTGPPPQTKDHRWTAQVEVGF
jgi:hypothetical protein